MSNKTFFTIAFVLFSITSTSIAGISNIELGKRYLKLGLSWINAKDYDKAEYYIDQGLEIAKANKLHYWVGVAYEMYGYLNYAQNYKKEALKNFKVAQKIYDKYGRLENDEGSNEALKQIIKLLEKKIKTTNSNDDDDEINFPVKGGEQIDVNSIDKGKYKDLEDKYKSLSEENKNLMNSLRDLQKSINELRNNLQSIVDKLFEINIDNTSTQTED